MPNAQWRIFDEDEYGAALDLNPGGLLLICYPNSPVLADKISQEALLWEDLGKPKVLLRPYAERIIEINPADWGDICIDLMGRYHDAGMGQAIEFVPANEFNIEGAGEDWPRQIDWLKWFATVFKKHNSNTRLHLPALSPSGYYLAGHSEMQLANVHENYDVVDCHVYSMHHLTDAVVLSGLYGKPTCVTEYNRISPVEVADYLARYSDMVEGAYWFILRWVSPEPGAPNVDLIGSEYYQAFKDARQPIGQPVPGNPSESSLSDSHDGGIMSEADRNRLWADYMAFPAFERFEDQHRDELGEALEAGERTYGGYRVKFFGKAVIGCRVGDWEHIAIWRSKEDLPDFT